MAVYYKFKSAKDYDSVTLDGAFISVGALKEKIFVSKHLGRGKDFDLEVTNAQTNEEYLDEAMLIPKNTSVLIRRVPGRHRMTIVTEPEPMVESKIEDVQPEKSSLIGPNSSASKYQNEDSEWDEFGNDLYAIPEVLLVHRSNPTPDVAPINRDDEEDKLKALINTPALDWQRQGADSFGPGRGFGRGAGGRMGGRGGFGFERKTPPEGYVCHRCNVPGHFIQHCPTNGDPNYDVKRMKQPTGIPKSMLMHSADGSYALPSGAVAVLKPNEDAFEREMEGLPSTTRSVGELPPELHCPLCKEVMKDAVLTSKCCFNSFCDKCIRDHIISKAMCVCGATNVLADDLLPNKTVRDTINRILETGASSTENAGSVYQVQDMESARDPQPKIPSPTMSSASKGDEKPPVKINEVQVSAAPPQQQISDKGKIPKVPDVSEATHESRSMREPASQGSGLPLEEEVQQNVAPSEAGKKKKKKKVKVPGPGTAEPQWRNPQDFPADNNYMMPPAYNNNNNNPYWNGMPPPVMDGYMGGPYMPPYMGGFGMGPMEMQFPGMMMPPDPFCAPGYMMMHGAPRPRPPQRNFAGFNMGGGMNNVRPPMNREEFEARQADLRRKRENESRVVERREVPKDRDYSRDMNGGAGNGSFTQAKKSSSGQVSYTSEHHHRDKDHRRSERPSSPIRSKDGLESSPPRAATKRKSEHHREDRDNRDHRGGYDRDDHYDRHDRRHKSRPESTTKRLPSSEPLPVVKASPPPQSSAAAAAAAAAEYKKSSVFSRISFSEKEPSKKRKGSSSSSAAVPEPEAPSAPSNGGYNYDDRKSSSSAKVGTALASVSVGGGRKRRSSTVEYESSDDDERHFKRKKPSRYEPSPPPPAMEDEEESWKESRGRSRDRDRTSHSKHRS